MYIGDLTSSVNRIKAGYITMYACSIHTNDKLFLYTGCIMYSLHVAGNHAYAYMYMYRYIHEEFKHMRRYR